MALPKAVQKAIRSEIERLTHLEAMIKEKKRAAELLLAPDDDMVALVSHAAPTRTTLGRLPFVETLSHHSGNGNSVGLRPVILEFLRGFKDHPVKAREVVAHVERSAYKPQGKTPLRIRVNAELYRLTREGKLDKSIGSRFRIKEKAASIVTS